MPFTLETSSSSIVATAVLGTSTVVEIDAVIVPVPLEAGIVAGGTGEADALRRLTPGASSIVCTEPPTRRLREAFLAAKEDSIVYSPSSFPIDSLVMLT